MIGHELHEDIRVATRSTYGDGWEDYNKTYQVCECGGFEQEYLGFGKSVSPLYLLHLIEEVAKCVVTDDTPKIA